MILNLVQSSDYVIIYIFTPIMHIVVFLYERPNLEPWAEPYELKSKFIHRHRIQCPKLLEYDTNFSNFILWAKASISSLGLDHMNPNQNYLHHRVQRHGNTGKRYPFCIFFFGLKAQISSLKNKPISKF